MKLIIEISQEDYEECKKIPDIGVGECLLENVYNAVKYGKPYEETPKGDLISREALKEKLNKKAFDLANGGMIFIESINHIIDNAPTVCGNNPKWCESCVSKGKCASTRPQGEWIQVQGKFITDHIYKICFMCSECKCHFEYPFKYCPNCGADMKGGAE